MTPVRLDFISTPRWLWIWAPTALAAGIAAGTAYAWHRSLDSSIAAVRAKTVRALSETQALRQTRSQALATQAADPKIAQLKTVGKQLQTDWNPAFSTIENITQQNARLLFFGIDSSSHAIRLEYEVPSMEEATALSAAMNGGMSHSPWKLENVAALNAGSAASTKMRATWSTRLDNLR